MIAALSLVALALAAVDPCAPVVAAAPDPEVAAAYRAVAEAERARGNAETAAAADRAAAERDPRDEASRASLARACADAGRRADAFEEGVRRMDGGDLRGAIAAFARARAVAPDPSAALLEGICHHELGEEVEADALLAEAERAPAHRDEARFYRGLVALQAGRGDAAARLFDDAAANPSLERLARTLARTARQEGRVVVSLLAETGWDSNVNLAPSGDPLVNRDADAAVALGAGILWRPLGASGPFLRGSGALHEQLTLGDYDFGSADGAAGWQLRRGRTFALAEYGYGYRTLGGAPFLGAHHLLASAGTRRGRLGLEVTYLGRLESYRGTWSGFSGTLQRGEARASWAIGDRARLAVGYGAGVDDTDDPVLSYVDHGPSAELLLLLSRRARLTLESGATFRRYARFDPALAARRDDLVLDAAALGELDLGPHLTARLGLLARQTRSNVAALEYGKVVPTVGLAWVMGR